MLFTIIQCLLLMLKYTINITNNDVSTTTNVEVYITEYK